MKKKGKKGKEGNQKSILDWITKTERLQRAEMMYCPYCGVPKKDPGSTAKLIPCEACGKSWYRVHWNRKPNRSQLEVSEPQFSDAVLWYMRESYREVYNPETMTPLEWKLLVHGVIRFLKENDGQREGRTHT